MNFWTFDCEVDKETMLTSQKVANLIDKAKKSIKIICTEEEAIQLIRMLEVKK